MHDFIKHASLLSIMGCGTVSATCNAQPIVTYTIDDYYSDFWYCPHDSSQDPRESVVVKDQMVYTPGPTDVPGEPVWICEGNRFSATDLAAGPVQPDIPYWFASATNGQAYDEITGSHYSLIGSSWNQLGVGDNWSSEMNYVHSIAAFNDFIFFANHNLVAEVRDLGILQRGVSNTVIYPDFFLHRIPGRRAGITGMSAEIGPWGELILLLAPNWGGRILQTTLTGDFIGGTAELRILEQSDFIGHTSVSFPIVGLDYQDGRVFFTTLEGISSAPFQLRTACGPDLNSDGALDFFDISLFLTAFSSQQATADFTNDGSFDFFDISEFLQQFVVGCNHLKQY